MNHNAIIFRFKLAAFTSLNVQRSVVVIFAIYWKRFVGLCFKKILVFRVHAWIDMATCTLFDIWACIHAMNLL